MGCSSCASTANGTPKGCGNKGGCSTGGCNKLNTFDWLSHIDLPDYGNYDLVEVSFKNGARKEIYKKPDFVHMVTGDHVAVESTASGYDVGQVSLMGELVRLQLKKYRIKDKTVLPNILRVANERDLERLAHARESEREAMIRARVIVRDLGLDMKIGDVEYQGDKRKITFYYTADGRVDFRELIRVFAREYRVKIEMRQIGARQESARIGGIGSCGRELCCSTWLTNFKSVSTVAARYQNLAINQSKLSGQCGRLKCCLNYELNTYLEVLKEFPKNINSIKTKKGTATLIKTDIFKRIMYFAYRTEFGIADIQQLSIAQVKELHEQNRKGKLPEDLKDVSSKNLLVETPKEEEIQFVDGAGSLELQQLDKKKRNRKGRNRNRRGSAQSKTSIEKSNPSKGKKIPGEKDNPPKKDDDHSKDKKEKRDNEQASNQTNRRRRNNNNNNNRNRNNNSGSDDNSGNANNSGRNNDNAKNNANDAAKNNKSSNRNSRNRNRRRGKGNQAPKNNSNNHADKK